MALAVADLGGPRVAPRHQQSSTGSRRGGSGHWRESWRPTATLVAYSVEATPASAVRAILLVARRCSVIAGINYGENMHGATSGTVCCAIEATSFDSAVAVSSRRPPSGIFTHSDAVDFSVAAAFARLGGGARPHPSSAIRLRLSRSTCRRCHLDAPCRLTRLTHQRCMNPLSSRPRRAASPRLLPSRRRHDPGTRQRRPGAPHRPRRLRVPDVDLSAGCTHHGVDGWSNL